ncbi:hypothetical protein JRO89_XS15G0146900 [Xanthoceras sorbifolium]|uniref:Uncharacterized protein n=1 Tax=Xanthoceras sorbifolium TaxID=99658 RepID=A0ABQ8H273_9ROSI|nr:hypothetical protein JRO89_XS15G0146900 [Xanthoceras sorbifolium]
MSSQVPSTPTLIQNDKQDQTNRRSANYPPSFWGDYFLSYANNQDYSLETDEKVKLRELKEEVRKMLMSDASKLSQKLDLIDAIQRLGVSYNFESEINKILQKIHETSHDCGLGDENDDDLYSISLQFRLLRQHGYKMSSDVFNKFKDINGNFKESLKTYMRGMLSLYEATHLRVHEENILDEALAFTTSHLKSMATQLSSPLADQVNRALDRPIRKGLQRLDARRYMPIYQADPSHNQVLLTFAKLDFNILQKLHQKELSELTSQLVCDEFIDDSLLVKTDLIFCNCVSQMKDVVRHYLLESKWYDQRYVPTMEEYMGVALVTSCYTMVPATSFLGMGDIVTKEAFEWVLSKPKMTKGASVVCRLMDDIVSHKVLYLYDLS